MEFTLIILFIIGLLIIGPVLGLIALSKIGTLEREVQRLRLSIQQSKAMKASQSPKSKIRREYLDPVRDSDTVVPPEPEMEASVEPEPVAVPISEPAESLEPERETQIQHEPALASKVTSKQPRKFEEELGARWAVWVGGVALAFGAIFLLRYAAEAGVFSPPMRIGLAIVMGLVAVGAGEWLRRIDPDSETLPEVAKSVTDNAYIPGILTAVGIFTLLGAIYAAYGIYSLVGPPIAFLGMGAVSLVGLALGLIHGPKMSALGLLAALVTPLLIHTGQPQYLLLYGYLAIVGLAALVLAERRQWPWLVIAGVLGLWAWSAMTLQPTSKGGHYPLWIIYTTFVYVAGLVLFRLSEQRDTDGATHLVTPVNVLVGTGIWGVLVWSSAALADFTQPQFGVAVGLICAVMMAAYWVQRLGFNLLIAGTIMALLLVGRADNAINMMALALWAVPTMGLYLLIGTDFIRKRRDFLPDQAEVDVPWMWEIFVPFLPLLCFASFPAVDFGLPDRGLAALIGGLGILYIGLVEYHHQSARSSAVTTHLCAAALSYIIALSLYFTGFAVAIGFMVGLTLFVALSARFKSPVLPYIVLGFAGLVAAHVLFLELMTQGRVGTRLILNSLWIYLAVPAGLCFGAARWFERDATNLATDGLKAAALSFAALFFVFQVRHLMNGGDLFATSMSLDELALQVLVGLCFTLGGARLRMSDPQQRPAHERLFPGVAMIISFVTLGVFALGVCLIQNPLFEPDNLIRGQAALNSTTLAYLLPALFLAAIAALYSGHGPDLYVRITGGLALLSLLLYLTTQVRFLFSGGDISLSTAWPTGWELYTISLAWLGLAISLLFAGLKTRRRDLRLASGVVLLLTVLKAFVIDMSGLEGVLRALAFVVLGVILIVIGRVYQRLLFSGAKAS